MLLFCLASLYFGQPELQRLTETAGCQAERSDIRRPSHRFPALLRGHNISDGAFLSSTFYLPRRLDIFGMKRMNVSDTKEVSCFFYFIFFLSPASFWCSHCGCRRTLNVVLCSGGRSHTLNFSHSFFLSFPKVFHL